MIDKPFEASYDPDLEKELSRISRQELSVVGDYTVQSIFGEGDVNSFSPRVESALDIYHRMKI